MLLDLRAHKCFWNAPQVIKNAIQLITPITQRHASSIPVYVCGFQANQSNYLNGGRAN